RRVALHDRGEGGLGLLARERAFGGPADQRAQAIAHAGTAVRERKLRRRARPCSEAIDSGWNWTPSIGRSRWRRPMMVPSSRVAVTSRAGGRLARSTIRLW